MLALNAPFLEPGENMDQQVINETPYRGQHAARRRVNPVEICPALDECHPLFRSGTMVTAVFRLRSEGKKKLVYPKVDIITRCQ